MALTLKQKEILNYQLGVLEGLCWVATMDEKMHPIAEALDSVREGLQKMADEDEHVLCEDKEENH